MRLLQSGWGDLNSRPLDPQSSALTKLRYSPRPSSYRRAGPLIGMEAAPEYAAPRWLEWVDSHTEAMSFVPWPVTHEPWSVVELRAPTDADRRLRRGNGRTKKLLWVVEHDIDVYPPKDGLRPTAGRPIRCWVSSLDHCVWSLGSRRATRPGKERSGPTVTIDSALEGSWTRSAAPRPAAPWPGNPTALSPRPASRGGAPGGESRCGSGCR